MRLSRTNPRIRFSTGPAASRGFSLVELLTAIAIITVLAGMVVPVFGRARGKARQVACCSNQKQLAVATGLYLRDNDGFYSPVYNNGLPHSVNGGMLIWSDLLHPYCKSRELFACPAGKPRSVRMGVDGDLQGTRYCMNISHGRGWPEGIITRGPHGYPLFEGRLARPSDTALLLESGNYWCTHWNPMVPGRHDTTTIDAELIGVDVLGCTIHPRHNSGLNISFCDGHVKWHRVQQLFDNPRFFNFWLEP